MNRFVLFSLLILFFFEPAVFCTPEIEPGVTPETLKKINWLDRYGTPVSIDRRNRKGKFFACQQGDHVLLRRPWGLEYTWINQDVVSCPRFFSNPKKQ